MTTRAATAPGTPGAVTPITPPSAAPLHGERRPATTPVR